MRAGTRFESFPSLLVASSECVSDENYKSISKIALCGCVC